MWPCAIHNKNCALRIGRQFGADDLAVRQIDSACDMALIEQHLVANVQQDEVHMTRVDAVVHVPAVGFKAQRGFEMILDRADTIVLPGWRNAYEPPPELLIRKLRAAYQRGARICSLCSGVFLLAAAGLLDGKSATTHWRYEQLLKERFPNIKLKINTLYVDEGQILTAAGSAAGLDMLLYLVKRDHGARIANQVAQRLVVATHRVGDQAQFVPRPMPADESARLSKLMDWVRTHLAARHNLLTLAKKAAMSQRTLQRHFIQAMGLSPLE